MDTLSLTKKTKICNGKKKASSVNGVAQIGCLYANRPIFVTLCKAQIKVDQKSQNKPDTLILKEKKEGKILQLIGTQGNFLNRTPML